MDLSPNPGCHMHSSSARSPRLRAHTSSAYSSLYHLGSRRTRRSISPLQRRMRGSHGSGTLNTTWTQATPRMISLSVERTRSRNCRASIWEAYQTTLPSLNSTRRTSTPFWPHLSRLIWVKPLPLRSLPTSCGHSILSMGQPAPTHTWIGCFSIMGDICLRVAPGDYSLPTCRENGRME